jgi:ABC-2 type transport system permease protein
MQAFLRRYLALTVKEIQQLGRNRKLLIQLIIPPTLVLIIFGFALNPTVKGLRAGVVDEAATARSRDFLSALFENEAFNVSARYLSVQEAESALRQGNIDLFVVVPRDFSRKLDGGGSADVQAVIDAVNANQAGIAQAYLGQAVLRYNQSRLNSVPGAALRIRTVEARPIVLYNPGLLNPWFFVTGIMSGLLFINGSLVAAALAVREKEVGTLEQLLMSPAQTLEILLAKVTPVFVVLIGGFFLALLVGVIVFDLPVRGSLPLLGLSAGLAGLCGIGIGVLIASFSQSQQQSQLLTFFINPPLMSLSGAFSPVENMPAVWANISLADPLRYLLVLVRGITLKGVGIEVLWPSLLILAGFAVLLFGASAIRFRRQLG